MRKNIDGTETTITTRFFVHELQIFEAEIEEASTLQASGSVYSVMNAIDCGGCGCRYPASRFRHIEFC
jgi:hypothetical protein